MDIAFQNLTKLQDYISTIDYRRFIAISLIILLLYVLYPYRQCSFRSPHFITFSNKSLYTTLNSTNQTTIKPPITKMIVVSHFNEDIDWLDLFIGEQIPHIVYTHSTDALARHRYNFRVNKGREAAAYLRYIVDHYSNLPSVTAFVHAHRTAWHQKDPYDIVVALRALQWNKYPYMPLTGAMTAYTFNSNTTDTQERVNYELWRDVLQKELGPPPKNGTKTYCCASFAATKDAILAHPKSFYSNISDYIVASPYSDQLTGRTLEYTWHMIFGQPAHIEYKTCDIFVCDSNGVISVQLAEKE